MTGTVFKGGSAGSMPVSTVSPLPGPAWRKLTIVMLLQVAGAGLGCVGDASRGNYQDQKMEQFSHSENT